MNNLAYYAEDARRKARQDRILHYDAIAKFIDGLFFCKDLKLSAANKEAACIVMIRDKEVFQFWLPIYTDDVSTRSITKHLENLFYIASVIKYLANTQQEGQYNLFIGYNTFRYENGYRRTKAQAFRSRAIGIDLDFNKLERFKELTYEESIAIIKEEHKETFDKYRPMIVQSGGGCQLYFLLDRDLLLTNEEDRHRFLLLSKHFNDLFKDCGADSHCKGDAARIFRPPLCYSLKYESPRIVQLTECGMQRSYADISDTDSRPKSATRKASNRTPRNTALDDTHALREGTQAHENIVAKRIRDLYRALEQVSYDIEGFRNHTIFIYGALRYAECKDYDLLLDSVTELNNRFLTPLRAKEITAILDNVIDKKVFVSNSFIYDTLYFPLGIDTTGFEGLYTAQEERAAERRRKAEKRVKKKKYSKEEKLKYINAHKRLSNKKLAEILCCHERTIKELRKAC